MKKTYDYSVSHVERKDKPFNMPAQHYHDAYEIYYLLNGERFYFINNRTYHVKKGNLVLINKSTLHKTNTTGKHSHERILVQFDDDILKGFKEDISDIDLTKCFHIDKNVLSLNPEEQLWIENQLFTILQEDREKGEGYLLSIKALIIELLIFINRLRKLDSSSPADFPDETHEKISEIASYINENFRNELSLDSIAEKFNYSSSYLSKAFKEVTGFNFVEYKNNVRIKEASKLLLQSKLNITEIAGNVGYNNLTHFGRIFKKITGYSPLEYRKMRK